MLKFKEYMSDFAGTLGEMDLRSFLINLLVTTLLGAALSLFYVRFGASVNNRRRFSRNFLPLALTTMLIISIVKSSIALSLGLVGALSIVRFRSAIKDPEELSYLFFSIGIGLATGANQPLIAAIAFGAMLLVLSFQSLISGKKLFKPAEQMHLHLVIRSDLNTISDIIKKNFTFAELRRVEEGGGKINVSFLIEAESIAQIEQARVALKTLDPESVFNFIEQRQISL